MIHKALFALATGTAILALPLAAHGQSYDQQPAATTTAPTTDAPQKADTKKAKPSDDSSDVETVIRAGPNAGQVINRHRRKDVSNDSNKAPPKDSQCEQPCV